MKKIIDSQLAPAALGPYVQAVDINKMLFVSGQLPINRNTGSMDGTIAEKAKQSLTNIKYILEEANYQVKDIVKMTIFLNNIDDFGVVNGVYEEFFKENNSPSFPTRSCVEVARLPKDADIEIEAIAVKE